MDTSGVHLLTVVSARTGRRDQSFGIIDLRLARQLLAKGQTVRLVAESDQGDGWPDGAEIAAGSGTWIVLLSSHGPEYEEAYPPDRWLWLA